MVVLVGGGEGITENQPAPSEMAWLAGWGGGATFVSGAISRDLVAPGLQNRFSSAPSTCSTVVRSGHHAGAVGMDGGGQVVQKQLIWESATSTDSPPPSQTFAGGLLKTAGVAPLKLAICFPTVVGKQMARSLS